MDKNLIDLLSLREKLYNLYEALEICEGKTEGDELDEKQRKEIEIKMQEAKKEFLAFEKKHF